MSEHEEDDMVEEYLISNEYSDEEFDIEELDNPYIPDDQNIIVSTRPTRKSKKAMTMNIKEPIIFENKLYEEYIVKLQKYFQFMDITKNPPPPDTSPERKEWEREYKLHTKFRKEPVPKNKNSSQYKEYTKKLQEYNRFMDTPPPSPITPERKEWVRQYKLHTKFRKEPVPKNKNILHDLWKRRMEYIAKASDPSMILHSQAEKNRLRKEYRVFMAQKPPTKEQLASTKQSATTKKWISNSEKFKTLLGKYPEMFADISGITSKKKSTLIKEGTVRYVEGDDRDIQEDEEMVLYDVEINRTSFEGAIKYTEIALKMIPVSKNIAKDKLSDLSIEKYYDTKVTEYILNSNTIAQTKRELSNYLFGKKSSILIDEEREIIPRPLRLYTNIPKTYPTSSLQLDYFNILSNETLDNANVSNIRKNARMYISKVLDSFKKNYLSERTDTKLDVPIQSDTSSEFVYSLRPNMLTTTPLELPPFSSENVKMLENNTVEWTFDNRVFKREFSNAEQVRLFINDDYISRMYKVYLHDIIAKTIQKSTFDERSEYRQLIVNEMKEIIQFINGKYAGVLHPSTSFTPNDDSYFYKLFKYSKKSRPGYDITAFQHDISKYMELYKIRMGIIQSGIIRNPTHILKILSLLGTSSEELVSESPSDVFNKIIKILELKEYQERSVNARDIENILIARCDYPNIGEFSNKLVRAIFGVLIEKSKSHTRHDIQRSINIFQKKYLSEFQIQDLLSFIESFISTHHIEYDGLNDKNLHKFKIGRDVSPSTTPLQYNDAIFDRRTIDMFNNLQDQIENVDLYTGLGKFDISSNTLGDFIKRIVYTFPLFDFLLKKYAEISPIQVLFLLLCKEIVELKSVSGYVHETTNEVRRIFELGGTTQVPLFDDEGYYIKNNSITHYYSSLFESKTIDEIVNLSNLNLGDVQEIIISQVSNIINSKYVPERFKRFVDLFDKNLNIAKTSVSVIPSWYMTNVNALSHLSRYTPRTAHEEEQTKKQDLSIPLPTRKFYSEYVYDTLADIYVDTDESVIFVLRNTLEEYFRNYDVKNNLILNTQSRIRDRISRLTLLETNEIRTNFQKTFTVISLSIGYFDLINLLGGNVDVSRSENDVPSTIQSRDTFIHKTYSIESIRKYEESVFNEFNESTRIHEYLKRLLYPFVFMNYSLVSPYKRSIYKYSELFQKLFAQGTYTPEMISSMSLAHFFPEISSSVADKSLSRADFRLILKEINTELDYIYMDFYNYTYSPLRLWKIQEFIDRDQQGIRLIEDYSGRFNEKLAEYANLHNTSIENVDICLENNEIIFKKQK